MAVLVLLFQEDSVSSQTQAQKITGQIWNPQIFAKRNVQERKESPTLFARWNSMIVEKDERRDLPDESP